jgi:hypothetical protein
MRAGSVLSGGGSEPLPKASAEDWVNMINEFQKGAISSRLGIPMIYGMMLFMDIIMSISPPYFPIMPGLDVPGKFFSLSFACLAYELRTTFDAKIFM